MLSLHIEPEYLTQLRQALLLAGDREIGGVLVAEQVETGVFRLVDFSVQDTPGSVACFIRLPEEHAEFMAAFHERTGNDFSRFNYLGEWHSHPLFEAYPSGQDRRTMQAIVDDPDEVAQFAVLLVVRLVGRRLQIHGTLYRAHASEASITVLIRHVPWWRRGLANLSIRNSRNQPRD